MEKKFLLVDEPKGWINSSDSSSENEDHSDDEESSCECPLEKPKRRSKTTSAKGFKGRLENAPLFGVNIDYKFCLKATEDHGKPIYGVCVLPKMVEGKCTFCVVGSNRISIYSLSYPSECLSKLELLQTFEDCDAEEEFYCCAWTKDVNQVTRLAAAGKSGSIRIFTEEGTSDKPLYLSEDRDFTENFIGHRNSVNDLIFHPCDCNLLFSASKDTSIFMWNLNSFRVVACFSGVEGEVQEVLSIDINKQGTLMASSGMDDAIKIWKLDKPEITAAIRESYQSDLTNNQRSFKIRKEHVPHMYVDTIHPHFCDCVKWIGSCLISKSCNNKIKLWQASFTRNSESQKLHSNSIDKFVLSTLPIDNCNLWFMRFSLDSKTQRLAIGNINGKVYVFSLISKNKDSINCKLLEHAKCNVPVRQTAFSLDSKVLICVGEDASIWVWRAAE